MSKEKIKNCEESCLNNGESASDLLSNSKRSLPYSWLQDVESTLSSTQGTKALESYLIHRDSLSLLEFIWACDGMKSLVEESPEKGEQLISCIYKNYIISGVLPILSNEVVAMIAQRLENYFERPEPSELKAPRCQPKLNLEIFDDAKKEVESYLGEKIFPQFCDAVVKGNVYVGREEREGNGGNVPNGAGETGEVAGKLSSQPEAFARALCAKLEGLMLQRN